MKNEPNKILYPDGSWVNIESPSDGEGYSLKKLQDIVGGYIQIVPAVDNKIMVVNEEGKYTGQQSNPCATELMEHRSSDFIVGPVLICDPEHVK
jgi:uncharacterized linocin/CFP29 family protein